jgi:CRP/FNR family transcriptional regulator
MAAHRKESFGLSASPRHDARQAGGGFSAGWGAAPTRCAATQLQEGLRIGYDGRHTSMSLRSEARAERILAALQSLPVFRGLSPEDQRRLAALASLREHQRGDVLWREGDPADHLTVIVRGRVKIVRQAEAGDVILEIFGEGEPVGSLAVYNCIPYPAGAVCLEPTTLLALARRDWFDLLDRNPEFTRSIIRELTRLTLALTRKVEEMRGQRVETRIAQLFLTLGERMGRPTPEGLEIPIQLTRQEVADLVGTTVETAIRVLSRWGREKLLVTGRERFLIPSVEKLREAAL